MSFWNFQSQEETSITKQIIDIYLRLLHSVESLPSSSEDNSNLIYTTKSSEADVFHNDTRSKKRPHLGNLKSVSTTVIPKVTSRSLLSSFFLHRVLRLGDFLDELAKGDKTVIDFICFGYFYTSSPNGEDRVVMHMDYLLDRLLACMDEIGDGVNTGEDRYDRLVPSPVNGDPDRIDISDGIRMAEDDNNDNDETSGYGTTLKKLVESGWVDRKNSEMLVEEFDAPKEAEVITAILTSGIWLITESLVASKSRMARVWSLLNHPAITSEGSMQLATFMKIHDTLLMGSPTRYLNFIRNLPNNYVVDSFLHFAGFPTVLEVLLRLIATDKPEQPTGILDIMYHSDLIPKCLSFFDNELYEPHVQASVSNFLQSLIEISANVPINEMAIGPNALTRQLVSPEGIDKFIDNIINQKGVALINTVPVVIELIRKNNSDYDQIALVDTTINRNPPSSRDPLYLGSLLRRFTERLPELLALALDILDPAGDFPRRENQIHEIFVPLGIARCRILELLAELLHCSNIGSLNTRRAEFVERRRDKCRAVIQGLQIALSDTISSTRPSEVNEKEGHDEEEEEEDSDTNIHNILGELDETFEIPYVSASQNRKLRSRPTIGDGFKVRLFDLQVLPKIMEVFLVYQWNDFWHNAVFDILQQLFGGRMDSTYNSFLVYSIFDQQGSYKFIKDNDNGDTPMQLEKTGNFNILRDFVLKGYHDSYNFYEKWGTNLGYMGHLILITEEIVKFSLLYKVNLISGEIFDALQDKTWERFVNEVLSEIRAMHSKILGSSKCPQNDSNLLLQSDVISPAYEDRNEWIDLDELPQDQPDLSMTLTAGELHEKFGALWG